MCDYGYVTDYHGGWRQCKRGGNWENANAPGFSHCGVHGEGVGFCTLSVCPLCGKYMEEGMRVCMCCYEKIVCYTTVDKYLNNMHLSKRDGLLVRDNKESLSLPTHDYDDSCDGWCLSAYFYDPMPGAREIRKYKSYKLPSGRISKKTRWVSAIKFCPLWKCKSCGKLGSARVIQIFCYDFSKKRTVPDLVYGYFCTGCRNRLRALAKKHKQFLENKTLTNKVSKEITDARKDQNQRRLA